MLQSKKGSQQPAPSSRQAPRPKGAKDPTKPVFQTSKTTTEAYQILLPTFDISYILRNSFSTSSVLPLLSKSVHRHVWTHQKQKGRLSGCPVSAALFSSRLGESLLLHHCWPCCFDVRTPQNTPANNAPISSHSQQPGVSSIKEGNILPLIQKILIPLLFFSSHCSLFSSATKRQWKKR